MSWLTLLLRHGTKLSFWGDTSILDMKMEFVGSAWEGKDHPSISLWTDDATVERSPRAK